MLSLSQELTVRTSADLGADQHLAPLFPPGLQLTREAWKTQRAELKAQWEQILGHPSFGKFDRQIECVKTFEHPEFRGTLVRQPTGPGTRQLLLLMEPKGAQISPRPGALVPFYHPDAMAGYDLTRQAPILESQATQFGIHLVRQGYTVVCSEAFPYNVLTPPLQEKGLACWAEAAAILLRDNPRWTGMGKLAWDSRLALDFLLTQPAIDHHRIAVMGHSLGGKIAFYTGALDERVQAVIGSDFGIGWSFTNWNQPWYLGPQIETPDFPLAHHQLLALLAPRAFLLIGGEADRPESRQYLLAAQAIYRLYGQENALGFFYHGTGHKPTPASITAAYRWLAEQFGLLEQPWELPAAR